MSGLSGPRTGGQATPAGGRLSRPCAQLRRQGRRLVLPSERFGRVPSLSLDRI